MRNPLAATAKYSRAEFADTDLEIEGRLDFHMTMTDSSILTETATFDKYWLALDGQLLHYECVIEQI